MKKRQNLILQSFGAACGKMPTLTPTPAPTADELAEWIREPRPKNTPCDLITYYLERQLKAQTGYADILGCGGGFCTSRILESVGGHKSGCATGELYAIAEMMKADAEYLKPLHKAITPLNIVLPAPSALGLKDAYYKDIHEFYSAICEVYAKLMREQRDRGVKSHILCADLFAHAELEELSHEKVFFFTPAPTSRQLSSILEYQNAVAIIPAKLPMLFELMNEYEVRDVCLINAAPSDFEQCLEHFDPENIRAGGLENAESGTQPEKDAAKGTGKDKNTDAGKDTGNDKNSFWKDLKEKSYVIRD